VENVTNSTSVADDDLDGDQEESFRWALRPTEMRKSKTYVRIYLIWMNLFIQVHFI